MKPSVFPAAATGPSSLRKLPPPSDSIQPNSLAKPEVSL